MVFTKDEQSVIDESAELAVGESAGWTGKLYAIFPALKSRNYTLYFSGQLISLIGTWLQIVAQSWLVLQLTNSAFLIGLVAALATLPTLLFALFGGVIVDRFEKRKILIFTQSTSAVLAFILGLLTIIKVINVPEIAILAFLLGSVTAIDSPARQSFVVELVGREMLPSAIALNSGIFNGARVIGPGVAGFLIAIVGTGGAFVLNAVSYIAVIVALINIHIAIKLPKEHPHPIDAIKSGVSYGFGHPIIRVLLIFAAVTSVFGWSYTTVLPVIAQNSFHLNAAGLGYLYAASGIGALTATVLVSTMRKKLSPLIFILGGNAVFTVSLFLFTYVHNLFFAMVVLYFAGLGLLAQFTNMNTTIQEIVKNEFRGRVMSLYTIMFLGLAPLGNLEIGFLTEHFGYGFAFRFGAVVVFLFGLIIYLRRNNIRAAHKEYLVENNS